MGVRLLLDDVVCMRSEVAQSRNLPPSTLTSRYCAIFRPISVGDCRTLLLIHLPLFSRYNKRMFGYGSAERH